MLLIHSSSRPTAEIIESQILTDVVEMTVRANGNVVLPSASIERLVVVVSDWEGLDELSQRSELDVWTFRCPAAARVDDCEDRRVDLDVDERVFAPFVVFDDEESAAVQSSAGEAR
jgi:hypothetical protein